ncbi:MAG: response regulator [Anaerolineae bacterium]|nr:response regulator [Anaerolineae bacterium]
MVKMHRILYIEDNRDNRVLVRRILLASDHPFEMLEAASAMEGIRIAREQKPDLILMDLSMPEVDGLTATRTLRAFPETQHIPVVALTANVMQADKTRTLAAGCSGYIGKPIDIDRFPQDILSYLRNGA